MKAKTSRARGFTLVELMAVVAVMGVLSAIAVPKFVSLIQRSDRSAREAAASADAAQRSLKAQEERPAPAAPEGLPDYESASIEIGLSASQRRYGSAVYTRTSAAVRARLVVAPPRPGAGPTRLDLPFPLGTTEAREYVLLAGTLAAIAFVTATYPGAGRLAPLTLGPRGVSVR